jgi:hypothetical protein
MSSLREAAAALFEILDRLGIAYAVGGSFASSVHGAARATQDLDLVVDLSANRVGEFHAAVAKQFYADEQAMLDALRLGRSFNLIHLDSGFKIDLFAASGHPLGREQLAHSRQVTTALLGGDPMDVTVTSAEDIVLAKLLWYRGGGEVSERQWNDLLNLARTQKDRLDRAYLDAQAARLGVGDLLLRLLG